MDQELVEYICESRGSGVTDEQISSSLVSAGWDQADLNEAFLAAEKFEWCPPSIKGKDKGRILIVEDNESIAWIFNRKLQASGFETTVIPDGSSILDVLSKNKFDLILLDLIMPNMNGFEVLQILRDRHNNIPIIVTSNLAQESDTQKVKELGAMHFFVKSQLTLQEMVQKIEQILKNQSK